MKSGLLPDGIDCCVAYDEPIILTLTGTLTTAINNLAIAGRRESTLALNSFIENILLVTLILTNKKLIGISTLNEHGEGQACFYIDFAQVGEMVNKSKLYLATTCLYIFELVGDRCQKGVTKYNGDFEMHIKIRGMSDDIFDLINGIRQAPGNKMFLDLITPSILKQFWGATTTTTWASRISRLRNELVRLCFIDEGIIVVSASSDTGGGFVSEVLHLNRMLFAFRRLHGSSERDIELFYVRSNRKVESILLRFFEDKDYSSSVQACSPRLFLAQMTLKFLEHLTALWSNGKMGTYHYLDFLNTLGGRSRNDYTIYPVFPWTLSGELLTPQVLGDLLRDCDDPDQAIQFPDVAAELRDLAKPMGAQDETQLKELLEKQQYLTDSSETPYLYGSHYSNASYVTYWLLRERYETNMLINEGHLDLLSRSFTDIRQAWQRAKKENNCFMELVPELYENRSSVLGAVCEEGKWEVLPKAEVHCKSPFTKCLCAPKKCACNPEWLSNDQLWFLFVHRLVLESPQVSATIHSWIDLIFGNKQRGDTASRENNLFHPASYLASTMGQELVPGTVSGPKTSYDESWVLQALEFGQCPMQIFGSPHPARQSPGFIWSRPFIARDLWELYLGFCSGSCSVLTTCSWVEFLLRHPRSFPPVARVPSVLYCSSKDHVIIRHGERDPRIWSGLSSTACLSVSQDEFPASAAGRPGTLNRSDSSTRRAATGVAPRANIAEWQEETAHRDLICRYSKNGRYRVFTCLGMDATDIYETSVSHKITTAVWDTSRHLYLGSQEGDIFVGGVGSHYQDGGTFAAHPTILTGRRSAHRGSISALKCCRDRLLSGCTRETVCVWDVCSASPLIRAEGWHNARITSLDIVESSIIYSADAAGVFAIHDLRCPPWRSEVFPPIKFEQDWFVSSMTRLPNSANTQLLLSGASQGGLSDKAVLTLDMSTCKSTTTPMFFGSRSHITLNGAKLKGTALTSGGVGVVENEGSDTVLVMREKDLVCYKDSKMIKSWELPAPGCSYTSVHAFPKLTDSTEESSCAILTPFIRAFSPSYEHTLLIC